MSYCYNCKKDVTPVEQTVQPGVSVPLCPKCGSMFQYFVYSTAEKGKGKNDNDRGKGNGKVGR